MKYRITANLKAADALFEKLERRGKDMTPLLDAAVYPRACGGTHEARAVVHAC